MKGLPEEITRSIPDELVPAVEALNKTLDDAHFNYGKITEVFCYGLLHPGENTRLIEQYKLSLAQLKVIAGQRQPRPATVTSRLEKRQRSTMRWSSFTSPQ